MPAPMPERPEASLTVDIVSRHARWEGIGVSEATLVGAARAAFAVDHRDARASEVALVLVGDEEMRTLNRDWRGKNGATNVLSFPADDTMMLRDDGPVLLGDVVLALETIEREAREMDVTLADHAQHLVVHGILHLLGLDHATDEEAETMEALESRVMLGLGLADPYARDRAAESAR